MNKCLLETFVTVVEVRRITAAAKLLNLTQPAVSQQIRHLEAYFGIALLAREQQGVRVTSAGKVLYNRARQILTQFDSLEREIDELGRADEQEVVIGATTTVGNFLLPCAVWTFKERFPGASLRLQVADNAGLCAGMLDRSLDLCLVEGDLCPRVAGDAAMTCRDIYTDRVILVTPVRSPWDQGSLTAETLPNAPLVLPDKETGVRAAFEVALAAHGLSLESLTVMGPLGGLEGMKAAVETHGGVLVTAQRAVAKELKQEAYRDITPAWLRIPLTYHLVYPAKLLSPAARRFIRFISAPEVLTACRH